MTDVLPRAGFSCDLLQFVRERYGLGELVDPVDLGGGFSLNMAVWSGRRRLVVRAHRPWVDAERLESLHLVRSILAGGGLPVADLCLTPEGHGWAKFGDRLVEVEEFVESDSGMDTWDRLRLGMPLLARLHDCLGVVAHEVVDAGWGEREGYIAGRQDGSATNRLAR
ncbi:hypothetical protein ACWDWO_06360 [Actinopolymorpha singaporensis]|uniref:Phosphotransferase enzyme family protein n=1 Tax=Actinopolymorpha singaporensis TaxID=117157 RepID=A0A1H1QXI0_9ACTN|nr:hypothetical protein [Actinopolymorpha singaporensis]SDS28234.1 hypothetical protein SAMN04489717_2192 [Actinopolymorpha singaporensis]